MVDEGQGLVAQLVFELSTIDAHNIQTVWGIKIQHSLI